MPLFFLISVLDALGRIGTQGSVEVSGRGTTIGTNAMLERRGGPVAFVGTAGFEDTIAIGRQTRRDLYDWFAAAPARLVAREMQFGIAERVSAEGKVLRAPSDGELREVAEAMGASGAKAIAVSLLFSFAHPETERRVEAALSGLGIPVSVWHGILAEFREYERASTTVVNAFLAPLMQEYLLRLSERISAAHEGSALAVMQSSGVFVSARLAAQEPVRTVLSGPAGGVLGASRVAAWAGFERIIGFDMGGTSTDVFLSDAARGGVRRTRESVVAGVPVSVPMLEIHTAGAGAVRSRASMRGHAAGGAGVGRGRAWTDLFWARNGADGDGCESAAGKAGRGELPGGSVRLDAERARKLMGEQKGSLERFEEFAAGIVRVVETEMEKAIRVISVEQGYDPREFTLVAFGGGGPVHACSLARALRIPTVLIPTMPGRCLRWGFCWRMWCGIMRGR